MVNWTLARDLYRKCRITVLERTSVVVYRPRDTASSTILTDPVFSSCSTTVSLTLRISKNASLSALINTHATSFLKKQMYACRNPRLLNFGRQMGVQCSPPSRNVLALNNMLKSNCRSGGCRLCRLGLTTLTSLSSAMINPYRSDGDRDFRRIWLIRSR